MDLTQRRSVIPGSDYGWLASSHGVDAAKSGTIDFDKLTPQTDIPNGYIQSGFAVGKNPSTGKLEPYSYGTSYAAIGFVVENTAVNDGDVSVAYVVHGQINNDSLPFPLDSDGIGEFSASFVIFEEAGS